MFEILADLNGFFESGEISEVTSQEILSIDEVIDVVLENTTNTAETLKAKSRTTRLLDAEINLWWNSSSNEYGFTSSQTEHKLPTLSMVVLTDWVFNLNLFALERRSVWIFRPFDKICPETGS